MPHNYQTVPAGAKISLACRIVAGNPFPTVTWAQGNKTISQSFQNVSPGSILIMNITAPHTGNYECRASNTAGSVIATTSINVEKPIIPKLPPLITISPNTPELAIKEGDQLNLVCSADGSPAPNVEWTRLDGAPVLNEYSSKSTAFARKFMVSKNDAGVYICTAKNEVGESHEKIQILVQLKPIQQHRIPAGDGAKISCKLYNSNKVISWRREEGLPLPSSVQLSGGDLVSDFDF